MIISKPVCTRHRYITTPRSRIRLRQIAEELKSSINHPKHKEFPALWYMEFELQKVYPNFDFEIETQESIGSGLYAFYDVIDHKLHIAQDVYDRASEGIPRDIFTVTHEIAHVVLLENSDIMMARTARYEAFRDPEWQANELAAELLAPHDEIECMTVPEIIETYNVSSQVARIQKNKK